MPSRVDALKRAKDLVAALEAMEEYQDPQEWFTFHEETTDLISRRGKGREQLAYSVPEELALRERVALYCVENENPGAGNLVAAVLDSFLRSHGYPPPGKAKKS
ncbi:hypothetical protein ACFY1P_20605 [Streptomyces sp. NPDC001407]|uniref:hypothetical protein n=1 Tax=Streptomyces sp. NPDC001407 TaxID=3364573 RepID=UPI003678732A